MPDRSCEVNGCDREPRSPNAALCNTHYFRKRRTGDTGKAEIWDRKRKPCSIDGCPDLACSLGLCSRHYQRLKSHGSPHVVLPNVHVGVDNWNWKADEVGYGAAHDRVRRARGSAALHACVECGGQARHWAYNHADPDERNAPGIGPYSVHIHHYQPMCAPCHKTFDLAYIRTSQCRRAPA